MKLLAVICIMTLGLVRAASAAPIIFDLDFITSNGLATVTGSLSIEGNDFTGIGTETFSPDGSGGGVLLSLDMVVSDGGSEFDYEADADSRVGFPTARFENGVLQEIDFAATTFTMDRFLGLGSDPAGGALDWIFTRVDGSQSSGTFGVAPGAVPEPAALFLFGLGLAGLGFARRRRLNT